MSERPPLLEKAERSFRVAEQLLSQEHVDFAASRTYYGFFYVADALLKSLGLSYSRHGQLVSAYGLQFAKTQRLDPFYHRLLTRAYRLRELADYQTEVEIEAAAVVELIEGGRQFLAAAIDYLAARAEKPAEEEAVEPEVP